MSAEQSPAGWVDFMKEIAELKQKQAHTEQRAKELEQRMQKEREEHKAEIADLQRQMRQQEAKHARQMKKQEKEIHNLRDKELSRRAGRIARALADAFEAIATWNRGGGSETMETSPTGSQASGAAPASPSVASSGSRKMQSPRDNREDEAKKAVRAELERIDSKPFDSPSEGYRFRDGTLMLAHLVKKEYIKPHTTCNDSVEFPPVLSATAALLGPYSETVRQEISAHTPKKRVEASLKHKPGAPLLQHSIRNIVRMPKALELSMDSADWVFEPVLPEDECCKTEPWGPIMWRFRCLDDSKEIDVSLQSNNHAAEPEPVEDYDGFKGCKATALQGVQHLWALKNFGGRIFNFDVKNVSIRALVFLYLHSLWQRFALRPRDTRKLRAGMGDALSDLEAGVRRVDRWVVHLRKLAAGEDHQVAAPSLEHLHKWLDALESRGEVLQAAADPTPFSAAADDDDESDTVSSATGAAGAASDAAVAV